MKKILIILISLLSTIGIKSQTDTTTVYRLTLSDDSEITGTIINSLNQELIFLTFTGIQMKIPKSLIKELRVLEGEFKAGTFYRRDPNRTRLLFAPTGRMLKPGSGYFSIYELFFPSLSVGITNFLSINGGVSILPGAKEQIYFFAPKIGYETSDNFSIAAGFLYLGIPDEEPAGILYSVATIGDDKNAFTFGGGLGLAEGEFSKSPVLMLGGELSLSSSVKLLSENWIFTAKDSHPLTSFGIRFYGDHIAADFGLIIPTGVDTEGFPGFPWVGFIYNY